MGYLGQWIFKHSSSPIKQRKVFNKKRVSTKKNLYSDIRYNGETLDSIERSNSNSLDIHKHRSLEFSVLLLTLLLSIFIMLKLFIYIDYTSQKYTSEQQIQKNSIGLNEYKNRINEGMVQGTKFLSEGKIEFAQKQFIDIHSLDPQNERALLGLTQIEICK